MWNLCRPLRFQLSSMEATGAGRQMEKLQEDLSKLQLSEELMPESYRINSPKEEQLLEIADNFQQQYLLLHPESKPLLLCPVNECGVRVRMSPPCSLTFAPRSRSDSSGFCLPFRSSYPPRRVTFRLDDQPLKADHPGTPLEDLGVLKVVERFHRNQSKPANEDVAQRVFLLPDWILLTYHLMDHHTIPSARRIRRINKNFPIPPDLCSEFQLYVCPAATSPAGLHIRGLYMYTKYYFYSLLHEALYGPGDHFSVQHGFGVWFHDFTLVCPSYTILFQLLEDNIVTFVKNELKKIQKVLSPDDPEHSETLEDYEEVFQNDYEEQRRISSEALMKITVNFLKMMKQEELANHLQNKLPALVCQPKLKSSLKKKFQSVFEGIAKAGNPTLLNQIYTELYITKGGTGEVNDEHEIRVIEETSRKPNRPETTIRQEDIFKVSSAGDQPIRTVMTKGVAGIGKTVLTQKFTLDWAEDKAHQNIQFIFPFTFRELNVLNKKNPIRDY
ncbi:PREDICTED: dynein regulatory complex subunit 7 [Cyprinodon variegatus]|uniref:dynein regulatory complex subunit 7 n=1 Tax=Cyprinodon variegatus TaxID=28743 RepID=UPI0007425288|nr:PREDICTED: dynein regulatory complex subunit 7 [Cyprinodon variegatus]